MGLPKRGVESVWPTSHAEFLGLIKYSKAFLRPRIMVCFLVFIIIVSFFIIIMG